MHFITIRCNLCFINIVCSLGKYYDTHHGLIYSLCMRCLYLYSISNGPLNKKYNSQRKNCIINSKNKLLIIKKCHESLINFSIIK